MVPIDWVELKVAEIKKAALENDVPLIVNQDQFTARV